ncbi:BA75_02348T0 [Komagataella pastoris]|uniref:Endoplasmic reticulum-Golgi intermediate compartment protein n=1 Tax=Komagataella pastoris TaxID=4922 RepID=A0A1B2JB38_PICPA|nr:BA75_02348T0 [Komagataella pastoris]
MAKPKLLSLDAFAKTADDVKVKTTSGGVITLICLIVTLILVTNEYFDYQTVVIRPELVVDRDHAKKLDISLNVTFHHIPCELLTMDVMDITGDLQIDLLMSGFQKTRVVDGLAKETSELRVNEYKQENSKLTNSNNPYYCGSCYGALNQKDNENKPFDEKLCCNTCESVKKAYAKAGWAFYDGRNIEQCENEGYVQLVSEMINEGCRVSGTAQINRVSGNLHFAPGSSLTSGSRHIHDLSLFEKYPDKFNFDHTVHHISFGKTIDNQEMSTHPLDGYEAATGNKNHLYSYFLKVVATRYESLSGLTWDTNQFSATYHDRPLEGGRDSDHPNTLHASGGIPGAFFHFEISPLKIINREQYSKTRSAFALGVSASVAGVLTLGSVLDKTIWTADQILRQKKDL